MRKRLFALGLLFTIVCLFTGIVEGKTEHVAASTPQPFLGPIYYGTESIVKIFDHDLPLFRPTDDNNSYTMNHDGTTENDDSSIYGYDQHVGVDYYLQYEPILAAASGEVTFADWSDPTDHRRLYGLHVQMIHNANSSYRVFYGHFSTLVAEAGDVIQLNSLTDNRRNRIIGISGNTGSVQGGCPDIDTDPLCGAHLHLEVRQRTPLPANRPVNPYGWVGSTNDPWSVHEDGATSYNLWSYRPSTNSPQYTASGSSGPELTAPSLANPLFELDDSYSQIFSVAGDCWIFESDNTGYENGFYRARVGWSEPPPTMAKSGTTSLAESTSNSCYVRWQIPNYSDSYTDEYDVYVHIPASGYADSLSATYTIRHAGKTDKAIVVQAAYPNNAHGSWAYAGRYDFDFGSKTGSQYIQLSNDTINDDIGNDIVADAIRFIPVNLDPVGCPLSATSTSSSLSWSVAGDGSRRIKASWQNGGSDLDYLNIYRNISSSTSDWQLMHTNDSPDGQWIDMSVSDGTLYYYWIEVFDCYGNQNLLGPKSTTTGVPAPPTDLGATYSFKGGIALSWQHTASDVTFNVYRSGSTPVPLDNSHRIANGLTTQFYSDPGGNMFHYYVVTAVKNNVESLPSNTATACSTTC